MIIIICHSLPLEKYKHTSGCFFKSLQNEIHSYKTTTKLTRNTTLDLIFM